MNQNQTQSNPEDAEQPSPEGLDETACSDLPDAAGFYWWRKYPDHEWRMVHIVDFSPQGKPYLCAYDVELKEWGGRTLTTWAKCEPTGEWMKLRKPNADGQATPTAPKP